MIIENGKENNASPSWEEECWDKRHKWWLETGVHQSTQTPTCEEGGTLVVASIKTNVHQTRGLDSSLAHIAGLLPILSLCIGEGGGDYICLFVLMLLDA